MFTIEIDGAPTRQALKTLASKLDDAIRDAFAKIAKDGESIARDVHGYTTRTGNMERNTIASKPVGGFSRDTLYSEVVAATEYASYLERDRRFAFMLPMARMVTPLAETTCETAVNEAIQESGL